MRPNNIDGINRYDRRRSYGERRLVVPPRPVVQVLVPSHQSALRASSVATTPASALLVVDIHPIQQPQPSNALTSAATPASAPLAAATSQPPEVPERSRKRLTRPFLIKSAFACLAIVVLATSAVLAYQTWRTNTEAHAIYGKDTPQSKDTSQAATQDVVPNEAPVSSSTKQQYTVAADMPRTISIDRIGVNARVLRMSVTSDGAIQAPAGIWDTGWYDGSAKPGQSGNAFIDGHISGPTMAAVFAKLKDLKSGDAITIERGDGSVLKYAVSSVTTTKLTDINMNNVLQGPGGSTQTLTIMTCGGSYQGNYTYDSRVIVQAVRSS
jgi:LPXTG-site transpeptidase (sortase) family protein